MSYCLGFPGKIIFGEGKLESLPLELEGKAKILLVVGNHTVKSGVASRVIGLLNDFEVLEISGIQAEPPLDDVDMIINAGRNFEADAVVAIGGGSVIDAAKAAAAIIPFEGDCAEYFYGVRSIATAGLFFVALPTTSGTGTEATSNAVLTDPETDIKKSIRHHCMYPDVAIVDPELTYSCSPALTAHSGLDAFTQAIESYISKGANTVSRTLAAKAATLVFNSIDTACSEPDNRAARSAMAEGSMMTAMAFAQSSLGAVHGLAHPIGARLHIPHGLCCAILLPLILRWNMDTCEDKLKVLAAKCNCEDAGNFIDQIQALCRRLGVPENFKEFGLNKKHYDFILKNCRSGSMRSNPRHLEDDEIIRILETLS
ncbi:iron-containing alcohol dehydrogenase [Lentisphaerota bacterium ZTH]|nr:iron-containing alcohol dehydrogenase [Lentisphaerota bacterium]WET07663.1 iron-containing alcohol dehydrogenase [Lentisphaerota bacterium ZTH]